MRLRISVLLFFTAFLLPPSISAQTNNSIRGASIHGAVTDPEGRPVPDATVTLLGALTVSSETRADAQGIFQFDGLSEGEYTLVANVPGFSSVTSDIHVAADARVTSDLHLKISAVEDKVVVTASLGGALAPEIGSSLTIVTADQIANQGTESVGEALRQVPGVVINRGGQLGAITSAFIRGGNSNYNLVMIDGIPMNDFGGGFDLAPLPTDGVQQIEVLRGPQSALYGENAVAGAINIITVPGEGEPHFSFSGEGGSNQYYRLTTSGSGSAHGFGWSYDFARMADTGPVIDDSYENNTSFVTLSYSRSPRRKIVAHFFGDAGAALSPGPWGSDPDDLYPGIGAPGETTSQHQNLFGYQASETEQLSNSFQQVSTVSVSTDRFFFPSSFGNSFSDSLRLAANTRSEITFSPKDVFVAGFEYDRETFKDTFITDANDNFFTLPRNTYAFVAENRWNPGTRWFISAGVRVDVIASGTIAPDETDASRPLIPANSITKADPRISAAFVAHQSDEGFFGITRLHSSFGTGIRPPDGFEMAFTNNPNLKPERSISGDAGIEQRFAHDRAVLDVTYFYNGYRDQIVSIGSLTDLSKYLTGNISKSRAYGLESSLRVHPLRSLELSAEYTWLNTAILALDGSLGLDAAFPFSVGQPLERRPRNSAGYDATWTWRRLMLNSNASLRGPVLDIEPNDGAFACELGLTCLFRNKGYVDANAGFAVRLPRGLTVYGHINNFLNQHYEEAFGFPALRLNFVSGIKWELPSRHGTSGL